MPKYKDIGLNRKIGKTLREARNASGMSLRDASECIEITMQQIHKYERGESTINLSRLQQFCEMYKVSVVHMIQKLLGDNEDYANTGEIMVLYQKYKALPKDKSVMILNLMDSWREENA